MKGLIIKYICIILWCWATVSIPCFSEETLERQLEKNIERIVAENYYLLETIYRERHGPVPFIAVYCDGGFYSLYDTGLECEKIGNKRWTNMRYNRINAIKNGRIVLSFFQHILCF